MSDLKKQPDQPGNPIAPPESESPASEPSVDLPAAHVESPNAVAAEPEAASPALPAITPLDPQALEEWNRQIRRRMRIQTRRSFLGLSAGLLAGFGAWGWLTSRRLAPTFPKDRISEDRVNGEVGLDDDVDVSTWKLQLEGLAGQDEQLKLDLDAIKKLPRVEMITEFKCIEGWSVIVQWAGARFSDFMKAYPPATRSGVAFSQNR